MQKITDKDHQQGNKDAAITLVEYGDYQCPACGQAAPVVAKVVKHFGDKLLFAFRNFPLEQHEFAESAAETAEFAASEGKFWEMHDLLYKRQRDFSEELFPELAGKLGMDQEKLKQALADETYAKRIQAEMEGGEKAGVPGTPAFFINGKLWDGGADYDSMVEALEGK